MLTNEALAVMVSNTAKALRRVVRRVDSGKGMVVETFLTDDEAVRTLHDVRGRDEQFAKSLLNALERYGRISQAQLAWAHKLSLCHLYVASGVPTASTPVHPPRPVVQPPCPVVVNMKPILALFEAAKKAGVEFPKIRFQMEDGVMLTLSVAGERAKMPGTVNVTNGKKYGEDGNVWFGRIDPASGVFSRGRDCTQPVADFLKMFSDDPAGVAARYGRQTGTCCFCGLSLKTKNSCAVGYGPHCAKKYNLPYGAKAVAVSESMKAQLEAELEADAEEAAREAAQWVAAS